MKTQMPWKLTKGIAQVNEKIQKLRQNHRTLKRQWKTIVDFLLNLKFNAFQPHSKRMTKKDTLFKIQIQ